MRMIDADALHEALMTKQKWVVRCGDKHNEGYTYDQVHFAIDEAPTIEAVSIDDYRSMENTCYKLQKALYEMADAPSIDIEPKRGEWETVFMSEATGWDVSIAGRDPIYGHRCSICKEETFINDVGEEMLTNFCPNCGARMKGADDE